MFLNKDMTKVKYDYSTAVFNCNYSCNDSCSFCFNANHLNQSPEISLVDVKDNYYYVKNKYDIKKVIISGGEPSLYSNFWEMMDFFYNQIQNDVAPSLNTNSIIFSSEKEYKKLFNLLNNCKNPQKQISISFSTVSSLKNPNQKEKLKIQGVKNTIKAGLLSRSKTLVIVIITKDNYKILPEIAEFLINLNQQYAYKNAKPLQIQLRNPYLGKRRDTEWMNNLQMRNTFSKNFLETLPFIILFIQKIINTQLLLSLTNIPLCLLKNDINYTFLKKKYKKSALELRMNIDFNSQFSKILPKLFNGEVDTLEICKGCKISKICNKIQPTYLEKGIIKILSPF